MLRSDGLVGACIARREVALRILGDEVGLSRKYDAAVEGDRRLVRLSEGDSGSVIRENRRESERSRYSPETCVFPAVWFSGGEANHTVVAIQEQQITSQKTAPRS